MSVLVLTGDGINCERETARAFTLAGAKVDIVHINDLLEKPDTLNNYEAMAFPGGFSFGDDLGSGQVLAIKVKTQLMDQLKEFVSKRKPIIGICNGFQALTKLGLLPHPFAERSMTLTHNRQSSFINRWVSLEVNAESPCIWTKTLSSKLIALPIRHGEGRVQLSADNERKVYETLKRNGQLVLRYTEDVNGSFEQIAGVCDPTGLVFGLMPHPEAAVSSLQRPAGMDREALPGVGLELFQNCVAYIKEKK